MLTATTPELADLDASEMLLVRASVLRVRSGVLVEDAARELARVRAIVEGCDGDGEKS